MAEPPEQSGIHPHVHVCVVYSPAPRQVTEVWLDLVLGATVAQALAMSGLLAQFADLAEAHAQHSLETGVWNRKSPLTQVLRNNDRVEVYRPLTVDPKVARRERFARQGAKTTGLFAKRREGAKAGY